MHAAQRRQGFGPPHQISTANHKTDSLSQCDGASPCSRCAQRSLQCNYEARHHRTKRSLRTEIKSLKRKYQEKEDVIERLRLGHQQGNVPPCAQHDAPDSINVGKRGEETSQNFGHGHSGPVSPPSPIASPHDQRWDQQVRWPMN
ncbi:uncharacterized protein VDAG_05252 [Verticillium dahliae VdLs.17]|uniref:Zn(2)-C6 fungal-type domain-containing protein n=1 Tax=Verticillium dahliae (strain VdLs.17 / ATCC MYA-4575 / FGSC 10137) TaxID=498257 RepID=G2X520_VERDV|nr:uncharacterized protein VDAG_05252 [Verticillium dahliae VdLs.17]EGY23814.1 hypothetical protein VDAG_05252 [Verticillium dahliae VdLs.17]